MEKPEINIRRGGEQRDIEKERSGSLRTQTLYSKYITNNLEDWRCLILGFNRILASLLWSMIQEILCLTSATLIVWDFHARAMFFLSSRKLKKCEGSKMSGDLIQQIGKQCCLTFFSMFTDISDFFFFYYLTWFNN